MPTGVWGWLCCPANTSDHLCQWRICKRVSLSPDNFSCTPLFYPFYFTNLTFFLNISFCTWLGYTGCFFSTALPLFSTEKKISQRANQRLSEMKKFMEQQLRLAKSRFSFLYWKWGGPVEKNTLYNTIHCIFFNRYSHWIWALIPAIQNKKFKKNYLQKPLLQVAKVPPVTEMIV